MLSSDAKYYCPACGSAMENLNSSTPEAMKARCILCAQTWTITTSPVSRNTDSVERCTRFELTRFSWAARWCWG